MMPTPRTKTVVTVSCALFLAWPSGLGAHPNNYPFDYDPSLSEDPAGIADDLEQLHNSLPGLPEGLVEIVMDGIAFDYFPETLDMIQRARDSGPEIAPPTDRTPQRCAAHAAFSMPSVLIEPASASCVAAEQEVAAAFDDCFKTCQEVEFPEVYVLDHPPGVVDADFLGNSQLLSTLEGQIALIGEALSHVDYPVGLIPDDFLPLARSVIAKIRYQKLSDNIAARLSAYQQAKQRLQSSASCFQSGPSASLQEEIDELIAELAAVGDDLDQLYADGLAQAAEDRRAVECQSRARNDLTHPALTDHEREMLAFYLAAIYWRMRGGGLIRNPANGDVPDIAYVINIFEGIGKFAGGLSNAHDLGIDYAIDESYGYAEWWDMGNEPGHDQYYDLLWMTDRGRRGVGLVSSMLGDLGYDIKNLVAGGLIMGPCYYYMWYELWARNDRYFQLGEDLQEPYYAFCEMPVATGEVCYGGAMGLGLARTLLWGTPNPGFDPCEGRVCGDDGCGGSCGECSPGHVCTDEGACEACEADCTSRECGDDGCGGSCGECSPGLACTDAGACEACEPDCTSRECGDDGCGGSCGTCASDETCREGQCEPGTDDCTGADCPESTSGCGCSGEPLPGQALPFLIALLLIRRRRSAGNRCSN